MAMDTSSITMIGRLTRDPEVRYFDSGNCKCEFAIACNPYSPKDGEQKKATFIAVNAWGRTAEVIGEHAAKGKQVCVVGRLEQEWWTDDNGNERHKYVIQAASVQLLADPRSRSDDE